MKAKTGLLADAWTVGQVVSEEVVLTVLSKRLINISDLPRARTSIRPLGNERDCWANRQDSLRGGVRDNELPL